MTGTSDTQLEHGKNKGQFLRVESFCIAAAAIFLASGYIVWTKIAHLDERIAMVENLLLNRFGEETIAACNKAAAAEKLDQKFDAKSRRWLNFYRVASSPIASMNLKTGDYVCSYGLTGTATLHFDTSEFDEW